MVGMVCVFPTLGDWGGNRPAEVEELAAEQAELLAWSSMLSLTAGRVTACPATVRPVCWRCQSQTWITAPSWLSTPSTGWGNVYATGIIGGEIPFGVFGGETGLGDCDGSGYGKYIDLERPVGSIASVSIDGVLLAPSAYRLEDARLRRIDGSVWPTTQNFDAVTGTGVFEVSYYQGQRPGALFSWAVGQLAAEFYLAMVETKGKRCRLPDNVTAVTRQGVTYQVNAGLFADGVTGIREIDAVLRHYNPNALKQATVVMSHDTVARRPKHITW